jgi:hypothetical protein
MLSNATWALSNEYSAPVVPITKERPQIPDQCYGIVESAGSGGRLELMFNQVKR